PLVKVFQSIIIMISCEINRNGVYHFFGRLIRGIHGGLLDDDAHPRTPFLAFSSEPGFRCPTSR
ncbi:MAG: hypothetical protein D6812_11800, partial [Deltaproteobacteria bacterium]